MYNSMQKAATPSLGESKKPPASVFDSNYELILGFCDEVEEMLSQFESNVQRLKGFVYEGSMIHEDYLSFLRNKDVREYLEAIEDYNRTVHTIKGTSLFMGLKKLNKYAHALEDVTMGIPSGDVILDRSVYRIIDNSTSVFGRFVDKIREEVSDNNFSIEEIVNEIDTFKINSDSPVLQGIRLRDIQNKDIGRTRDNIKRKPKLSLDLEVFDKLLDDYMMIMNRVDKVFANKDSEAEDASEIMSEHLNELTNSTQTTFDTSRYSRIIGDLANLQKKKVEYNVVVNDAKARPDIWEHVHTALIHMHRNAVDHGIETFKERQKFGKDPCASIKLSIWDDYKNIYITLSDDGRGMDPNKIAAAAIEKGVVSMIQTKNMSNNEKLMLIFTPGFSTKTTVSEISGRGVGMDAVIHEIQTVLGGRVDVSSEIGGGTKFTLHFPKSNSLTDCLMVGNEDFQYGLHRHQEMHYVVINNENHRTVNGELFYLFRKDIIPIVDLFSVLGHRDVESEYLVIIKSDIGKYIAISVPDIFGHTQLRVYRNKVIKSPYFFGQASYRGRPLVVLDIDEIIGISQQNRNAATVIEKPFADETNAESEEEIKDDKNKRWGIVVEASHNLFLILNHNNVRFYSYDKMPQSLTPLGKTVCTEDGSFLPIIDLVEKFDMKCDEEKKMIFTMADNGRGASAYVVPNVIDQAELNVQGL